ncbi:hypothetical protein [Psychrobacter sp. CAL346-MNA-CIBAN-0220]|uniref:hypothetical protein n=1 Tax=Psychrobacter sp. CAL346-MNA-CIBAN-0220 TaxID=3140457 RepID=UPI0033197C27
MSSSSKYKMSSCFKSEESKGFMCVTTGQTTEKVAQDIGKDKFDKVSDNYLELGFEDSGFKVISLDTLQNLTEFDRNERFESQKVVIFLIESEASFEALFAFHEEIASIQALTCAIVPSTIDEIISFKTEPKNILRNKINTLSFIPTFAVPFITLQAKTDFVKEIHSESYNYYYSFVDFVITTVCTVYRQDDSMIGYDFNDWKQVFSGNRLLNVLPTTYASDENKNNFKTDYLKGLSKVGINPTDIKDIICVMSASSPPSLEQTLKVTETIEDSFAIFCTTTMKLTQDLAIFEDPSITSVNVIVSSHFEER